MLFGDTYDEAEKKAKELAVKEGKLYISPYNDERIVAGHGTVGLEILKELPNVDVVIVPVGGGGLIGGIAIAVKTQKPTAKVIGVQSAASPVMYESLKAGKIVPPHRHERYTIAEGLVGAVEKGSITFSIAQQYVDEVTLAREESLRRAVYLMWKNEKQVVEGSGAAGIGLLLENKDSFIGTNGGCCDKRRKHRSSTCLTASSQVKNSAVNQVCNRFSAQKLFCQRRQLRFLFPCFFGHRQPR